MGTPEISRRDSVNKCLPLPHWGTPEKAVCIQGDKGLYRVTGGLHLGYPYPPPHREEITLTVHIFIHPVLTHCIECTTQQMHVD